MNTPSNIIFEQINDHFVSLLERRVVPWQKPWPADTRQPRNPVTGRPFRGINLFLLLATDHASPYWLSRSQVARLGGTILNGEQPCSIVRWRRPHGVRRIWLRHVLPTPMPYEVFNVEQCEGLTVQPKTPQPSGLSEDPHSIVTFLPRRPSFVHDRPGAFYNSATDCISLPDPHHFKSRADFVAVLYHQFIHATGHSSRLDRPCLREITGPDPHAYGLEELTAELGTALLFGYAGLLELTQNNSEAYCRGWIAELRADPTLIVRAAQQAQKAVDYVLKFVPR